MTTNSNYDCIKNLKLQIKDFKQDLNNMKIIEDFIDELLSAAIAAVGATGNQKIQFAESVRKSSTASVKGSKIVNRAKGMVVRLFDSVCNCAQATSLKTAFSFNKKRQS